jgi:membrane protein CcdC involved in cytochrome C biogenesis
MQHQPPLETTLFIYLALAAAVIVRQLRPRRMRIASMWIGPVIFLALTAAAIFGEEQVSPMPPALIAGSLLLGAALGVPFGILRGAHTSVSATDRRDIMLLGPSWIVAIVWVGAFVIRAGLRYAFAGTAYAAPLGDGLLAFAIGMLITSYYVIYRKYRMLEHQAGQI